MRILTPTLLALAAVPLCTGCAAYFQTEALDNMAKRFNDSGSDLYIHDLARLKQTKKIIVPDFRVIFPTDMKGAFKTFEGTSYEGTTFIGDAGLGIILAEHFEEELIKSRTIEVLERNQLQRILNELNLQMNGFIDSPNFQPGKLAGADTAILGTVTSSMYFMPNNPMLQTMHIVSFRLRVIDLKTGNILMLYRDKHMTHGEFIDEEKVFREFAVRFVETLKKQGILN